MPHALPISSPLFIFGEEYKLSSSLCTFILDTFHFIPLRPRYSHAVLPVMSETKFLLVVRVIKSEALRWAGYVMCEAKFCLDNLMERGNLGNLGVSRRNTVLGKWISRLWTGLSWCRIQPLIGVSESLVPLPAYSLFSLTGGAVCMMQGSGQSGMLPGDTHLSVSSSCEDPTQNLTPFLEQCEGEASMYWFFCMVVKNRYNSWGCGKFILIYYNFLDYKMWRNYVRSSDCTDAITLLIYVTAVYIFP